jgi:hypothetical protein
MSKYKDFTKKIFDWAIIGGGMIFPRSLRGMKKNFELGPKIFFLLLQFLTLNMTQY